MKLKHLLYLFVFCIPFQVRHIVFETPPAFNEWTAGFLWATDILFAFLLLEWIVSAVKQKSKPKLDRIDWILVTFTVLALISISFAEHASIAWYRFFKLLEYVLLFFYIKYYARSFVSMRGIATTVAFSGFVQASIGIAQYLAQASLGLRLLGESVLNIEAQGVAVFIVDSQKILRAYGTTPHPNVLAVWLMLALWAFGYIVIRKTPPHRAYYLVGFAVTLIGFYLTYSRIPIAIWGVASLILAYRCGKKARPLLVVAGIVSLLFVLAYWPLVRSRMQISSQDEAVAQRIFYAQVASQTSRDQHGSGIGIGQFVPMLMKKLPHYPPYIYQPAHAMYLLILDELGVIGLLIYVIFLFAVIKRTSQSSKPLVIMAVAMLALGVFDHLYWTLQQGGLIIWGFLGMIDAYDQFRQ